MKPRIYLFAVLALVILGRPLQINAEGTWTALSSNAPTGVETMMLLSDGTVMAQFSGASSGWWKLTPDNTGHYINGFWTNIALMHYTRLYYSSDMLTNGQVFLAGAEYGTGTTNAEIYNPLNDSWNLVNVPNGIINPNNTVGSQGQNTEGFIDSASVLVSNGKVLITPVAPATAGETVTYDPVQNIWGTATLQVGGNEDEASPVKLPDDSILVIDDNKTSSERYIPSQNVWVTDGTVPNNLYDIYGGELGAGFLLPNGNVFMIGSAPYTAIYTPSGNTSPGHWNPGPSLSGLGAPDAPAAMMNNGKILCVLSPTPNGSASTNIFTSPSYFYEYDYSIGSTGKLTQIHAPGGGFTRNEATYNDRMLDLPDGTVLFTDGGSQLYIYQPDGSPLASGQPVINSVAWNTDASLHITGTLFNGISQGAAYGDDVQVDSNYPLVRFTDSNNHVLYGRTYNWSSSSVQTGGRIVSTEVTVPPAVLDNPGAFALQVVANGNPSAAVNFYSPVWVYFNYVNPFGIYNGSYAFPYNNLPQGLGAVANGGTIAINATSQPSTGHESVPLTISKPVTIISVYGPSTISN